MGLCVTVVMPWGRATEAYGSHVVCLSYGSRVVCLSYGSRVVCLSYGSRVVCLSCISRRSLKTKH